MPFPHSEKEIQYGEEIDPDNALYNYELAGLALMDSVGFTPNNNSATKNKQPLTLHIRNRKLLEQAMSEVRAGLHKPYVRSYKPDFLTLRLNKLSPPGDIADAYHRAFLVTINRFPLFSKPRQISLVTPLYAKLLISEGRITEAMPLIEGWKHWTTQMVQYPDSFMTLLVVNFCAGTWGEGAAQCYEEMGQQQAASQTRKEVQRFVKPVNTWLRQPALEFATYQQLGNATLSPLSRLDIGLSGRAITDNSHLLTPQRVIGYSLFEAICVKLMLVILCVLLLGLVLIQVITRISNGKNATAPLLLLFRWQDVARIAGYAILLPLASYVLYTNLPISARNLNIEVNQFRFAIEMLLLLRRLQN